MRHGKYQSPRRVTTASWILVILAVLGMTIGGVVAYLSASTGSVTNTFEADKATDPSIVETMENNEKKNVKVSVGNPGYAVYVRAAVVVTWQDDEGNVLAETPVQGSNYEIMMNGADWFEQGGFWYCRSAIDSEDNGTTPILIESCSPKAVKGDYHLSVEIIAQTIQALGTTDGENPIPAVQDAWGVYISDGELVPTSPAASPGENA